MGEERRLLKKVLRKVIYVLCVESLERTCLKLCDKLMSEEVW